MSSITTRFRVPRWSRCLIVWVLSALLASTVLSAWAAQPLLPKADASVLPAAASATPPTAVPGPPVYFLKISYLFMNGKRSEDETDQFSTFLDKRRSWHGTVEQTQEGFLALRQKCEKDNLYCDVIKIDEEIVGSDMTMSVMVFTTPEAHRTAHGGAESKPGSPSAIPRCPLKDFKEKMCRETLMNMVIGQLAGMDKSHPLSSTLR